MFVFVTNKHIVKSSMSLLIFCLPVILITVRRGLKFSREYGFVDFPCRAVKGYFIYFKALFLVHTKVQLLNLNHY